MQEHNNIFKKVQLLIANDLNLKKDIIKIDQNLRYDLEAELDDFVEIIMSLEMQFDIIIDNNDFFELKTVGDIVEYVTLKLEGQYHS